MDRSQITKNSKYIDYDKVFIPGSGGSGNDKKVLGIPVYAPKNSVCSQSFLFAAFDNKKSAESFLKYIYTKFFRVLVSSIKITQSAPKRVYQFVPLQDFTENSDIDWSKSITNLDQEANAKYECKTINEIDSQLYKKYNFTKEEVQFIESMIKPME